jgi:hypothetical protein
VTRRWRRKLGIGKKLTGRKNIWNEKCDSQIFLLFNCFWTEMQRGVQICFISKDRKVFSFWQGKENTFLRVK